ncbi:hypothetical protein KCM76_20435 [Zooshikella marina]|uniref:Lipoprotein n=1 Tax=Zooshikella ganghwensis TaxID=202772 RepID=A0A4P9VLA0_9GAMM|nr:hypothetical protein [Zooshikella ganghwensis]MBU2708372.1 hypothetical protein [Zooshikella ganghwensis]RDH42612.1 hypothetical protein B9G39_03655 [Zooshikella ganghwensis]
MRMIKLTLSLVCAALLSGCFSNPSKPGISDENLAPLEKCTQLLPAGEKYKLFLEATIDTQNQSKPESTGDFSISNLNPNKQTEAEMQRVIPFTNCIGKLLKKEFETTPES